MYFQPHRAVLFHHAGREEAPSLQTFMSRYKWVTFTTILMMCDSNFARALGSVNYSYLSYLWQVWSYSLSPREAYKAELEHFLDVAQGEAHLQVICCVHIKMWWWLCWWCWWCWRWWSCTRWQGRWCWQWQRSVRKQHSQAKVDKRW